MVGNTANFNRIDVLRCLLKIEKPVSRSFLSKSLELGEGTIRSILDILKKMEFLVSNNAGHSLSQKGKAALDGIKKSFAMKKISISLFPGKKAIALQIKSPKSPEKAVILRDEAVRNGAEGALILKYDAGKLKFYEFDYNEDLKEIENELSLGKNDLVIISYSNSYKQAEHGAIAAAVLVDSSIREFLSRI